MERAAFGEFVAVLLSVFRPGSSDSIRQLSQSYVDTTDDGTWCSLQNEEWPRAYVTLKDGSKGKMTSEDIQNWMKGRVAKHKQMVGGIKFIDEVPKFASGKIKRKVIPCTRNGRQGQSQTVDL